MSPRERTMSHDKTGLDKLTATSIGRPDFAERIGIDIKAREAKVQEIEATIRKAGIEVVRFCFVDTHGKIRNRPLEARHFAQGARNGVPLTTAHFAMDSANSIFKPVFEKDGGFGRSTMGGAGDMLAIADLSTFRVLPWANATAMVLCDMYLSDGEPCPFDPRLIMRKACGELAAMDLTYVGGVEIECHVFRVDDPRLALSQCTHPGQPAGVSVVRHGYQYMSDLVLDEYEPIVHPIRQALIGLGLPLRTVECEWGPGQLEITLDPLLGMDAADAVIYMRTAVKQVCTRLGLIATFMTKPGLPNVYSSGWHLHQSLAFANGSGNAFVSADRHMSHIGFHFVGGLLDHAPACTALSNPSINGYKRLNANPLAPSRAVWSIDNKGAMCRLVGGAGDRATHIENRSGEPLANPYLYMGSQIFAGLDGMARKSDPGDPSGDPYGEMSRPLLPATLDQSIDALDRSQVLRTALGEEFVDHFVAMKRHELGRFLSHVTDWEQREYFEAY